MFRTQKQKYILHVKRVLGKIFLPLFWYYVILNFKSTLLCIFFSDVLELIPSFFFIILFELAEVLIVQIVMYVKEKERKKEVLLFRVGKTIFRIST